MELKEQIRRIQQMEEYLEQGRNAVAEFAEAFEKWKQAQAGIRELDRYYGSKEWLQDLEEDEKGRFPRDLKRGVLSQDLVYDLLMENQALRKKMSEIDGENQEKEED